MKTRDKIIKSASSMIRKGGYHGTGINDLIKEVQVPKGSLYHHFPGGKDEIVDSALEQAAVDLALTFKNAMKGKKDAVEGLNAVIKLYIDDFTKDNLKYGCPLAMVSLDLSNENESLRMTCSRLFDFWIDAIASYLKYKGVKGDIREKAESFLIQLEGAIMMARVQQSIRPFQLISKDLEQLLK